MANAQDAGGALHRVVDFRRRAAGNLERKAHVLRHRHVRIQRIVLKHHRRATLDRGQIVGTPATDQQITTADFFQSGNHAQHRRLATAGRADENHEFPILDIEVDASNHRLLAIAFLDSA